MTATNESLERDNRQCQVCGSTDSLHSHHLQYRSKLGSNDADNRVTLCANCHALEHAHKIKLHIKETEEGREVFVEKL